MKIKKGISLRNIAGESILMLKEDKGVDMTKVISLNSTSEWLWSQISDIEFSTEEIVNLLISEYEVSKEQAQIDATKWVDQLVSSGVIE